MDQRPPGTPEMLKFAPQQKPRDESDPIDQAGHALVAMVHEAAKLSSENVDRAMTMAHKLSIQLRAAEDRISQLQAEVEHLESRATRAEHWLHGRRDFCNSRGGIGWRVLRNDDAPNRVVSMPL